MPKWKSRWMQILRCLLALPLVFGVVPLASASNVWYSGSTPVFRHVNLPSDITPTAMLQDRNGMIGVASLNGLANSVVQEFVVERQGLKIVKRRWNAAHCY